LDQLIRSRLTNAQCYDQNENDKFSLTQKVGKLAKVYLQYSYYPCNQNEEDELRSGIVCESDPMKIKSFFKRKSLSLGWIEQAVSVHAQDLEATAKDFEDEYGQNAYYLQSRYQEVRDFISNLEETKIVNFKF